MKVRGFWSESIAIAFFIEVIQNILIPASERIHRIIEAHISPVDYEIIGTIILIISRDEIRHHNRKSLLLRDLINAMNIVLNFLGKFFSTDICHRNNKWYEEYTKSRKTRKIFFTRGKKTKKVPHREETDIFEIFLPETSARALRFESWIFLVFSSCIFSRNFCINGAQGGTRTPTPFGIRTSSVHVYQFHHLGRCISIRIVFFLSILSKKLCMVHPVGFEPTTDGFEDRYSSS